MMQRLTDLAQAGQLAALEAEVAAFSWSEGMYRSALDSSSAELWCCYLDGEIAGVLVLERVLDELTIQNLFVVQTCQRRGVARQCLRWLQQQSRSAGDWRILLEVRAGNQAAIRLYQQAGFQQSGLRKAYYRAEDGREDAILMEYVHV